MLDKLTGLTTVGGRSCSLCCKGQGEITEWEWGGKGSEVQTITENV